MSQPNAIAFNRREQYEQRRRALVREAARVFAEKGAANASLDDIAGNLNVTKAALYHYFKSKDEILFECFTVAFDIADAAVAQAEAEGKTGAERIELYIRRHIAAGVADGVPTITAREEELVSAEYTERIARRRHARRDKLRQFVAEGIADGSVRECDPRIAIVMINGILLWLFRVYRAEGPDSADRTAGQITSILLHGLATPRGRKKRAAP